MVSCRSEIIPIIYFLLVAFIWPNKSPRTDRRSGAVIAKRFGLTISFKMLISLKSMRFSSSSMWLFLSTLTARCAVDSLCTHMRTSPNAPICTKRWATLNFTVLREHQLQTYQSRGFFQSCNDLWAFPVSYRRNLMLLPMLNSQQFSLTKDHLLVSTIVASFVTL